MVEPSEVIVEARDISSVSVISPTSKFKLSLTVLLKYAYIIGVLFLLLRFIFGLTQLAWLMVKNGVRKIDKDYIVFVKNLTTPFSFFHLIFIDRNDLTDRQKACMLYHERVHIRQWHSVDLLLLEFIIMVQWFNPFAWLIRRTLKEIHEYMADEGTVKEEVSSLDYLQLLLVQASDLKAYLTVNGFRNSLTKKRILMITSDKRNSSWIATFVILVIAIIAIDSFTRIGLLQAPTEKHGPILSQILEIFIPSKKGNTLKNVNQNYIVKYDTVKFISDKDNNASPSGKNDSIESKHNKHLRDSIRVSVNEEQVRSVFKIERAFTNFIKEHWQIPDKLKNDTSNNVFFIKVLLDEDEKSQKIIKGEPWDYLKYRLNNNFTIIDDPQIIEELSKIAEKTPFDFLRYYNSRLGIRFTEISFWILIKTNEMEVRIYSWRFVQPDEPSNMDLKK